ncbi:MAG: 3-oxoacyl-[acyl-carrier-protein] reductase [Saprospiraceae bacterium]|nr:3-oxoacyl-[acyl-carrier-protein] reductase [Saprospiraceae bacterium]
MSLLSGKVALITGGSRGIGQAIVEEFVKQGASVAFTYVSDSSKEKSEALIQKIGGEQKLMAYKSNAADFAEAAALIDQVMADFGRIDILINNAGITRDTLMLRMTEEQWDEVIHTNLKSVFNLTKHVLKPMLKQRGGSIIHMSSVVGVFGNAGQANYAASKAGIIGFSKSIAKEVGSRGIRSNVIAPGFIATDMTHALTEEQRKAYEENIPLKRLGDGVDVANACVFLGSDMGSYITGQTLSVCGGLLD